MRLAPQHEYSSCQKQAKHRAHILEWVTLAYLLSVATLMYIVMGSSQAMKSAWIEDMLSMVPPIMFLLSHHYINKPPTENFPYGFHRVSSLCFFVSALALLLVGGYLVVDSGIKLVKQEHPDIGMKEYFGIEMWLGWWMILVLIWGTIPPVLLGRAKMKLASTLFDKNLYTDAKMNKADWMTAVAAIGGVIGIRFGLWWADAVAALFISFDILKDGYKQTRDAVCGLVNRAPREFDGTTSDMPKKIIDQLEQFPWVKSAEVRLHEEGHLFFGEGFIIPVDDALLTKQHIQECMQAIENLDWRIKSFPVTVVPLDQQTSKYQN